MGLREAMQSNPATGAIVAVAILAVSAFVIMCSVSGSTLEGYYYDVQTGELFTAARDHAPPIDAPSGPGNGLRAYVFACGTCDGGDLTISYIEKLSPEAAQLQATYRPSSDPQAEAAYRRTMEEGHHVATPPAGGEPPQWVPYYNPAGQALVNAHHGMCGSAEAVACLP